MGQWGGEGADGLTDWPSMPACLPTRISELCVPCRVMVLDALQQMKLTAHHNAEK